MLGRFILNKTPVRRLRGRLACLKASRGTKRNTREKKTKRIYDLVDIVAQVNSMLYKDVSVQLMSSFLGPWAPSKYKSVIYNCTGCIKKG